MSYQRKTATVEYEPGKTSVGQLVECVRRTNKYTAALKEPVVTRFATDVGAWKAHSDVPVYSPASRGKLMLTLDPSKRARVSSLHAEWSGEDGLSVTAAPAHEDPDSGVWTSTAEFEIAREVQEDELLARATVTYRVEGIEKTITLGAVVPVAR